MLHSDNQKMFKIIIYLMVHTYLQRMQIVRNSSEGIPFIHFFFYTSVQNVVFNCINLI